MHSDMDAHAPPVAGPSSSQQSPQRGSPRIASDAIAPRHSSKNQAAASSPSPPSTPTTNRRRPTQREQDRDKRPLRPSASVPNGIDPTQRHSHGLSWSSTTRDSVVDGLLVSLDSLSRSDLSTTERSTPNDSLFDTSKYMFSQKPPPLPIQSSARGLAISSSTSNDGNPTAMLDSPTRRHDRRSLSGSHPQRNSTTSARTSPTKEWRDSRTSTDIQKATTTNANPIDAVIPTDNTERGRFQYPRDLIADKANKRWKRRSMSVDQIFADSIFNASNSVIDRGRPVPSLFSKYDAGYDVAPEPLIAGGPRAKDNPAARGPVYLDQAAQRSTLRKVTTHTDLRMASAQSPLSPTIPPAVRTQATNFVRQTAMQSRPGTGEHSKAQPSPASYNSSAPNGAPSVKERPGFFRRMFGGGGASSRSSPIPSAPPQLPQIPVQASSIHPALRDNPPVAPQPVAAATPQPSKEIQAPGSPSSLNKKPSTLFRRRKKSLANAPPPPPLPLAFLKDASGNATPMADSLLKAMDPYLADNGKRAPNNKNGVSRPSTRESTTEDSDNPDIFHSGYTPKLGTFGKGDLPPTPTVPKTSIEKAESTQAKMKVTKRTPEMLAPIGTSFLLDPSSKDLSATSVSPVSPIAPSPRQDTAPPPRSASKASTGKKVVGSPVSPLEPTFPPRKPSVVSSVGSDRPDSKTSNRVAAKALPREPPLDGQASLSKVSESQSRTQTRGSPTVETTTGTTAPSRVYSPISTSSQYHSATSLPLPGAQTQDEPVKASPELVDEGAEYRERARKIYEGDEEDVTKAEASAWLGERNTLSTRTLAAYLDLFDFTGVNILAALRLLCEKLELKGETQQFDRIITALSARWCACNASHGFKAQDVIHTICYSLILLNTDLHLADIEGKMSRSAYVKNTLPTIRRVVADAAPNAFDDTIRPAPQASRPTLPWSMSASSVPQTPASPGIAASGRQSLDERPGIQKQLPARPTAVRQDSDTADSTGGSSSGSNALVKEPWSGSMRAWESEIDAILKSFFVAIKLEPLPLRGGPVAEQPTTERNLSVANLTGLKRSNSVLSKNASDTASSRSKPGLRSMTLGKYNLSRTKIYSASTLSSSKTSFDDGNSLFSPAQSTWSRTLTSASAHSLGQHSSAADFKHSIGFANALSQAIIREEHAGLDNDSASMSVPRALLDDEALTLEGAPWAKEGLVKHKHHLETPGKKAKERNWVDCFAVISKGKLTLFAFHTSTTKAASMGRKALSKNQAAGRSAKVGGGDWMENAEQLDSFVLRQTIASTLPPPGYSKTRPHVWALSLPTGAVHLFQVGTLEIAREFMSTANYWSARLSKEPLSGGVSNVEYGWSEQVINPALIERTSTPPPSAAAAARNSGSGPPISYRQHKPSASVGTISKQSMTSSLRTSLDAVGSGKARLPADKVHLAEWQPPTQSMMASQLMEVDQLKALTAYVGHVEAELARHNELKGAIELAFTQRHTNYNRALANWQKKSEYLLRENIKFQTYVDSLAAAQKAREQFYTSKTFQAEDTGEKKTVMPPPALADVDVDEAIHRDLVGRSEEEV